MAVPILEAPPECAQLRTQRRHLGLRLLAALDCRSSLCPGSRAVTLRRRCGCLPRGRLALGLQDAGLSQLARLTELHHLPCGCLGSAFQCRDALHRRAQGRLQLSNLVTLVSFPACPFSAAVSLLRAGDSSYQGPGVVG